MTDGIRCMWMRGGTSKGAMFLADDLPTDPDQRDDVLLRLMGSPDPRQVDGIGGSTTLSSKAAVVSASDHPRADVDYLFLQVGVDGATVSTQQNCGNILAAVGPFAVERGLVAAEGNETAVRIHMVNSGSIAVATFPTSEGQPDYEGETHISGVPGTAAGVRLDFAGTEGSATGALFPTGRMVESIDGTEVTCVDNGMPVVIVRAESLGLAGDEPYEQLVKAKALMSRIDQLRQKAGVRMGLGSTAEQSIPKTVIVSAPVDGGHVCTRSFIPTQPHSSIGVLAAISTVTGLLTPGTVGHELTEQWGAERTDIVVEHPSGTLVVNVVLAADTPQASTPEGTVLRSGVVRTARKLFDGHVFPRSCTRAEPQTEGVARATRP
jgi:4-oxalomesaconate tautomerase